MGWTSGRFECEYDQSISDLNKSAEDQCDQIISDLKKIVSDLNKNAEDQCEQIISDLTKAAEIEPDDAGACCDRGRADDAEGECDFTELQKDYTQMKTIKHFRLHINTCDIYAIEQWSDGRLVGSCGPLAEDDLKDLNSYDYSDEQNDWVQENINRLILWFPWQQVQEIYRAIIEVTQSWAEHSRLCRPAMVELFSSHHHSTKAEQ